MNFTSYLIILFLNFIILINFSKLEEKNCSPSVVFFYLSLSPLQIDRVFGNTIN